MIKADFFTCKKYKTTFILSILVFIIHMPSLPNYNLDGNFGGAVLFVSQILNMIAKVAVPLFLIISGALFYRNYEPDMTLKKYKSRFKSLVIPYLSWNIIWVVFNLLCSYTPVSKFFINRQLFSLSVGNILGGIFFYKAYGPFWFIFDLIVFTLFCPLLYLIVKNKKVGTAALLILIILNMFGYGLPEEIFYRHDALTYYLAGALIGRHGFSFFKRESTFAQRIIAAPVCLSCIVCLYFEYKEIIPGTVHVPILFVMCFAFWFIMDFFVKDGYHDFETISFLIFAMHLNVGAVFAKLLYLAMPKSVYFAPVNYVLTIVLTVIFIYLFDIVLRRIPYLRRILTGQR